MKKVKKICILGIDALEYVFGKKMELSVKRLVKKIVGYWNLKRNFLLKMMPKNSVCCEIGVWRGNFSKNIIKVVKPSELHLVDPWKFMSEYPTRWYGGKRAINQDDMDKIYQHVVNKFKDRDNVIIHRGTSNDILSKFPKEYFDWVYIDGNHDYEYVKNDLELCYEVVKPRGYITGDDYYTGKDEKPIKKAVDEFCYQYPVEMVKIKNNQYILRKIDSKWDRLGLPTKKNIRENLEKLGYM